MNKTIYKFNTKNWTHKKKRKKNTRRTQTSFPYIRLFVLVHLIPRTLEHNSQISSSGVKTQCQKYVNACVCMRVYRVDTKKRRKKNAKGDITEKKIYSDIFLVR